MKYLKYLISIYNPKYPLRLAKLIIESKGSASKYFKDINKTQDFNDIKLSKKEENQLIKKPAGVILYLGILIQFIIGAYVIYLGATKHLAGGIYFGLAIIVCYPLIWAYLSWFVLLLSSGLNSLN